MSDRLRAPFPWAGVYKPVPGHSRYEVSDCGAVRRTADGKQIVPTDFGKYGKKSVGVELVGDDGKTTLRSVANWMLRAHVGPPPDGCGTRHLNGDYRDNRLANLAWGTHSENMQDSIRHGTFAGGRNAKARAKSWARKGPRPGFARGERHGNAKLTADDIRAIRADRAAGVSFGKIAKKHGIAIGYAFRVVNRMVWKHV